MNEGSEISNFVKYHRGQLKMTQEELAERAGVGLRFIRELEQGKKTLRIDKVNEVLQLFGYILSPSPARIIDAYEILLDFLNRAVVINLRNKTTLTGILVEAINDGVEIKAWKFVPVNDWTQYQKTGREDLSQVIQHLDIANVQII